MIRAFLGGLLHGAMLAVAQALTSPSAVLPVFIKALTGSDWAVGALVSGMQLGAALAGLPAAAFVEPAPRKKVFLYLAIAVRASAFLLLAVLTLLFAETRPAVVVYTLLFSLVLFAVFGGLGGVAYLPVIGKAIPPGYRGLFFGARSMLASLAGGLAGLLSRPLWGRFPEGFALAFFLAFLALVVGFWGFWLIPEPPDPPRGERKSFWQRTRAVLSLLKKPKLRMLLFSYLLVGLYFLALPFYAVAAREAGLPAEALAYLVAVSALAEGLNLFLGRWMDRAGAHVGVRAVAVLAFLAPLVAYLGEGLWAAVLVFMLVGVVLNGIENAYSAYLLSCAPREEAAGHTALLYLASAPRALWPLVGAALAGALGYRGLFLVTAGVLFVAVVYAFRLPKAAEHH